MARDRYPSSEPLANALGLDRHGRPCREVDSRYFKSTRNSNGFSSPDRRRPRLSFMWKFGFRTYLWQRFNKLHLWEMEIEDPNYMDQAIFMPGNGK